MGSMTDKQFRFIKVLAEQNGFNHPNAAAREYGFDDAYGLSASQASELIDWLKYGKSVNGAEEQAAMAAAAEADRAKKAAEAEAAAKAREEQRLAFEERQRRTNEELARRGLGHLTGKARSDARYAIQKDLGI